VLRHAGVQREEGLLELLAQLRRHLLARRPDVIHVRRSRPEHHDLVRVHLLVAHHPVPHLDVERARLHLAGLDHLHGRVVRAAEDRLAVEVLVRIDLVLVDQVVARHQVARGGALRAERERLALEVGRRADAAVLERDEDALELAVDVAHAERHRSGQDARLHVGEPAQPGEVDLAGRQRLHRRAVVGDRDVFDLGAQLALEVGHHRLVLALELGRVFVRDAGDAHDRGWFGCPLLAGLVVTLLPVRAA
jgi:hypothetical protein